VCFISWKEGKQLIDFKFKRIAAHHHHMSKRSFLETKTKFSFHNQRANSVVPEASFASWSNKNFYRTSYNDMSFKVSKS